MARRMLDLLQRLFRLHPCELDIRGDFESPCPEYFLHRCLAPCVERICSRETYLETVETVHLILSNQGNAALEKIEKNIERLSDELEFELAAEWRDKRLIIEEIINNAKWQIDISAMIDVITLNVQTDFTEIHLTTLRRGKSVGSFYLQTGNNQDESEIIKEFIEDYYRYFAPKQIYVQNDFPERKALEEKLTFNFKRKIKITAQTPDKLPPSIFKTNNLAPHSFKHGKNQSTIDKTALLEEMRRIFGMQKLPRRIECFDVAHLAGKEIVAARVVALNGVLQPDESLVWEFENLSETAARRRSGFRKAAASSG
jgi:excinuclease ABC subunit C